MISWINGDLVDLWQTNQKFFVLINCQGLGYEIQILESFFLKLKTNHITNKNITLWIKHIKKEDSDLLFGFTSKPVSYTHLRAHETKANLVCRLLLEKKKQ